MVFFTVVSAVVFEASGKVVLFMFPKGLQDFIKHIDDNDKQGGKAESKHDVLTHFIILGLNHQFGNVWRYR